MQAHRIHKGFITLNNMPMAYYVKFLVFCRGVFSEDYFDYCNSEKTSSTVSAMSSNNHQKIQPNFKELLTNL